MGELRLSAPERGRPAVQVADHRSRGLRVKMRRISVVIVMTEDRLAVAAHRREAWRVPAPGTGVPWLDDVRQTVTIEVEDGRHLFVREHALVGHEVDGPTLYGRELGVRRRKTEVAALVLELRRARFATPRRRLNRSIGLLRLGAAALENDLLEERVVP